MKYKDRTEAGRRLAVLLSQYAGQCLVLGLPNGGIPVGIEIARGLGCDFDLLFVSKITPSFNSEVGYGSVSESGRVILNKGLVERLGLNRDDVDEGIRLTKQKIRDRVNSLRLRGGRRDVRGKTVILTDDGLASGYTMVNAIETVKERGAAGIVVAVPTAPQGTVTMISGLVREVVCPDVRDTAMFAVADAYGNWYDIDFNGAMEFLRKSGYAEDREHDAAKRGEA